MRNLVEPREYRDLFLRHPPIGFEVASSDNGLSAFRTEFDILTTLDANIARILGRMPFLPRLFRLRAGFIGATITEYAPLPDSLSGKELVRFILEEYADQTLTVIKDIPLDSPLLTEEENDFARELTREAGERGFFAIEGQALAYVAIDFKSVDEYLGRLSRTRRKDLRRKMKADGQLEVSVVRFGDSRLRDETLLEEFYVMFKAVYDQSEIHFDLPSRSFFRELLTGAAGDGVVMLYHAGGELAGYNICLVHNGMLIDKYIGFKYPLARKVNLYFVSWFHNLRYALENDLKTYVAGWTDPEVKKSLGASFAFTRHLVRIKNPLLRTLARPFKRFFESDKNVMEKL